MGVNEWVLSSEIYFLEILWYKIGVKHYECRMSGKGVKVEKKMEGMQNFESSMFNWYCFNITQHFCVNNGNRR